MSLGVAAGDCFLCREHVDDDVKPSPLSCALSSTLALCKEWEGVGSVGRRPGECLVFGSWLLNQAALGFPLITRRSQLTRGGASAGHARFPTALALENPREPWNYTSAGQCTGREWRSVDPHSWPSKAFASDVRAGLCCRSSWRSGVLGAPPHQLECQR